MDIVKTEAETRSDCSFATTILTQKVLQVQCVMANPSGGRGNRRTLRTAFRTGLPGELLCLPVCCGGSVVRHAGCSVADVLPAGRPGQGWSFGGRSAALFAV